MHTVNMKYKSPGNIQVLIKNKKKKKKSSEKLHPLEPLVQKLLTLFNRIEGKLPFLRRSINHFKLYLNSLQSTRHRST